MIKLTWSPRLVWFLVLACGVGAFVVSAQRTVPTGGGATAAPARFAHSPLAAGVRGAASMHRLQALPVAAQPVISGVLGARGAQYAVHRTAYGLSMSASGLRARFTAHGVRVNTAGGSVTLSLQAIGRGNQLQPTAEASPTDAANQVFYRDGPVSERFVNGPLGLEQVFTVTRRPGGTHGPLTIALRLGGGLSPSTADAGRAVVFRRAGGQGMLRYAGLRVSDARGRTIPARLVLSRGRLLIEVSDRSAVYPLIVDPTLTEITNPGDANGEFFGESAGISGDTIAVGASEGPGGTGVVYVFAPGSDGWTQAAVLHPPSDSGTSAFGASLAISGSTIVVGMPWLQGGETANGGVAVFVEPPGGWASEPSESPTTVLLASTTSSGEELGYSVAVSGSTVVAGSPDTGPNTGPGGCASGCDADGDGIVYVWTEPTNGWASEPNDDPAPAAQFSGGSGSALGASVAIDPSAGGSHGTIVAGAPDETTSGGSMSGALEVYTASGSSWTQQATLDGAAANDQLGGTPPEPPATWGPGTGVAISGGTIVAGAPEASDGAGAAYIFTSSGSSWSSGVALLGPTGWPEGSALGSAVAISGDTVLVGDYQYELDVGAAFEVTKPSGGWVAANLSAADELTPAASAAALYFGSSLAISGSLVAAGAVGTPVADQPGQNAGAVFVNQSGISEPPSLQITSPANGAATHSSTISVTGTASDSLGLSSVTVDGSAVTVTAGAFSTSVSLTPGSNTITAVATGADNETTTKQVTVTDTGGPAPMLSGLSLTNPRFRVSGSPTPIVARAAVPFGTAFHLRLSAASHADDQDRALGTGSARWQACVPGTARLRKHHAKSCSRTIVNGTLTRTGEQQGADVVAFTGRIGSKALHPGHYTAIAVATDPAGRSKPASVKFTIVS